MRPFPVYSVGARRAGGLPANTVPPSISGTVAHGNILTAIPGTWTGSPSITGQWYADASPISGETGTTYTCDRADGICGAASISYRETDSVSATSADSNTLVYTAADLPLAGWSLDEDVTVVGGEVDSIAPSFGSFAWTVTAFSAAQRPAYDATGGAGGRPRMILDGIADVLIGTASKGSAWDNHSIGCLGARVAFGSTGEYCICHANGVTVRWGLEDRSATTMRFAVQSVVNINFTTDPDGYVALYSGNSDNAVPEEFVYVNGVSEGTNTATVVSRSDGGSTAIGGRADGASGFAAWDWRAGWDGESLTADQFTDLRALLTRRAGVAV